MKQSVVTRYRVMAYVTGVLLIVLTIGVIAKYLLDVNGASGFVLVVGSAHGWLFALYLVFAFDLSSKAKMPFRRMLWVMVAGTIPTAVFFVEHRVVREVQSLVEAAAEPARV